MNNPCKTCYVRKWYAKKFDIHFSGEDCPYICTGYDKYMEKIEDERDQKAVEAGREAILNGDHIIFGKEE